MISRLIFRLKSANDDNKEEVTSMCALFQDASDDVLVRFLRARKYDAGRAWELMKGKCLHEYVYVIICTCDVIFRLFQLPD